MTGVRLRPMQERDLPAIFRLEEASQAYPWPHGFFRRTLRRHTSCWVLEKNNEVLGFGILAFENGKAHIMNLCVAASQRRHGLGRRILLRLLAVARKQRARQAWLEVRTTNRPARQLYGKLGFVTKAVRKGYYLTPYGRQNAIIMTRKP